MLSTLPQLRLQHVLFFPCPFVKCLHEILIKSQYRNTFRIKLTFGSVLQSKVFLEFTKSDLN